MKSSNCAIIIVRYLDLSSCLVVIILPCVCVVISIMSLPAAYYPIEFSAQHRLTCGMQRLRNIIERLHLSVFVLDISSSAVRFSDVFT